MADPSLDEALRAITAMIQRMDRDDHDGIAGASAAWHAVNDLRRRPAGAIEPLAHTENAAAAFDKINELVRAVNELRAPPERAR